MNRTQPTLDGLKKLAEALIEDAKESLLKCKNIVPKIVLGDAADGSGDTVMIIDPVIMGDEVAKGVLTRKVRGIIAEHGYMTAVQVLDVHRLSCKDAGDIKMIRALGLLGFKFDEIHEKFHVGELTEEVLVVMETVAEATCLSVEYHRNKDGAVSGFEPTKELPPMTGGRFKFF